MAVIATLSKGYDLDYIWKEVDQSPAKDAAGYYIQASETGGEPPGRWWGSGAQALGLQPGQVVERKPYDLLFGERKASDGTPLGRPPGSGRRAADIYTQLLAAEPHATAERKRELLLEATRQARESPLFFDLTLSLSKSISIFHASLGENARLARQAGDEAGDQYWSGLVAEVDAMIWQAVRAGFDCFQREAGYTRTGSHNKRVNGRETGQWHEADLVVAQWLQHTSRDGDMQLHVHSQIAHVARTGIDGKWRAPDSLGYNEHIGAVAAITAQYLEEALTARFGLQWTARDDGHGFEINGISGEMMRLFSSRRQSITADLRARAARFEQRYGRAPSQRELAQLGQASNFATRKGKEGALDFAQLHVGWADRLARTLGVPLAEVPRQLPPRSPTHAGHRLLGAVAGAASSVGIVIGGLLTSWISWRWGLFINVPVGAAVIALAPRYLPETDRTTGHFDLLGALTGTLGMTGIVYGFVQAGSSGWSDPGAIASFVAGAALLGGFLRLSAGTAYFPGIAIPMVLLGGGLGIAIVTLTTRGIAGVAPEDSGAASGLLNVAQQVGASLGLGILTSVFAAASSHASSHPAAGLDAKREAAQVLAHGVSAALTGAAVFLVIALAVALVMTGRRRTEPTVADAEPAVADATEAAPGLHCPVVRNVNSPIHPAMAGCRMSPNSARK